MATDLEQLVLSISADNRQMLRVLKKLEGDTSATTRKVEKQFDQMAKKIDARLGGIGRNAFQGLLGGAVAALGVRELQQLADIWTDLTGRVELAAGSHEKGIEVMGRLQEMARRTYSGLEQTTESYLRNSTVLKELGYSTKTQLDYTEALNNALVVSGAKGDRARSVMEALSKAMALGKLSGDNLNTVLASGDRVAKALADSMGVTTLELRKLGSEGKITRKELIGIIREQEKLRKEADGMQETIADAVQILKDALLVYVGAGDQAIGISARLADAIILVADNFETVGDAGVQLAFVIVSSLIGRALLGVVSMVPTTVAAITTLTTAMRAGTLTAAGFSAALGPIGLAAGALVATLYLLSTRQSEAEKAAELHETALKTLTDEIGNVDYANKDAVASTRTKIASDIKAAEVALERAIAEHELANALQAVADQRAGARPGGREYQAFGADTSKVKTGGSEVVAQSIIAPQVDKTAEKVALMKKRVEEIKALSTEFEDYASGRKKPPQRDTDRPVTTPGDDKKSKKQRDNDYERLTKQIVDRTAAMVAETEVQRQLNPLLDDYGYAVEKARAEHDLLTAAQKAGVEITPRLRAEIEGLAEQYAVATVEAAKLAESQDEIRAKAEEAMALAKDVTRGLIDGFIEGRSAADMMANALKKIGDALINDVLNNLFKIQNMGGGGGGFLSGLLSLFGGGGFSAAAYAGIGQGLYSSGGYTGPGPKNKPAGVVHAGEVVWSQDDIRRAGGVAAVEAMRKGMSMPAQISAPVMPKLSNMGGGGDVSVTYAPVYHVNGSGPELDRLRAEMARDRQQFKGRVVEAVADARRRNINV